MSDCFGQHSSEPSLSALNQRHASVGVALPSQHTQGAHGSQRRHTAYTQAAQAPTRSARLLCFVVICFQILVTVVVAGSGLGYSFNLHFTQDKVDYLSILIVYL